MPNYDAAVDNILLYPYYMFLILIFLLVFLKEDREVKKPKSSSATS